MRILIILSFFATFFYSCTVLKRAILYGSEDIDDHRIFPKEEFKKNKNVFHFSNASYSVLDTLLFKNNYGKLLTLEKILSGTSTRGFAVCRNDSILFEKYFNGYSRHNISTVFSISKSVTSLLAGIAIDEGYIKNVNDPVTDYVKELRNADPLFRKLTIKHLLDMQSGLAFSENYSFNPFSKIARLYYGTHQMKKIKNLKFSSFPGSIHQYQSASTAILGLVIEKATGKNLGAYFGEKIWEPLGMENTGSWSLDDNRHRSAKAYGGLNISVVDLIKIGLLYVNEGIFNGKKIVSKQWVKETLTPNTANNGYQNQWYSEWLYGTGVTGNKYFKDSAEAVKTWQEKFRENHPLYHVEKISLKGYKDWYIKKYMWPDVHEYRWQLTLYTGNFYAQGIMGQVLYIDPQKKITIVRLGDKNDLNYQDLMYSIVNKL